MPYCVIQLEMFHSVLIGVGKIRSIRKNYILFFFAKNVISSKISFVKKNTTNFKRRGTVPCVFVGDEVMWAVRNPTRLGTRRIVTRNPGHFIQGWLWRKLLFFNYFLYFMKKTILIYKKNCEFTSLIPFPKYKIYIPVDSRFVLLCRWISLSSSTPSIASTNPCLNHWLVLYSGDPLFCKSTNHTLERFFVKYLWTKLCQSNHLLSSDLILHK